jgi:putative ABC transport system substrate-binding protein
MTSRRQFISLLGGAAATWPLTAKAQQPAMPVIGFLTSLGQDDRPNLRAAFRRGLSEAGYTEGRNVAIEYRFAENQHHRLPGLAADLVDRKVAVIAATGGGSSVLAAKAATSTIPIVFAFGSDPVREGLVASLNRPGGNVTGASFYAVEISGKALGLLHELVPSAAVIALMVNPRNPESTQWISSAQEAARTLGRQLLILNASTPVEIDTVFATLRKRGVGALLAGGDSFFTARRQQIVALAARDGMPAIFSNREYVAEGGLMSYGNDIQDVYRRTGAYAGRILKGEKPWDLPVDLATKFEFVINLKTAKTLGIEVPHGLSARADEVIE